MVTRRTQPRLLLTPKKTGIAAFRERPTLLGRAAKVLTSGKTTAVLGATLGTLLFPAAAGKLALGTVKGVGRSFVGKTPVGTFLKVTGGLFAGATILESSRAKGFIATRLNPTGIISSGTEFGKIIDDPGLLLPTVVPDDTSATLQNILETVKDLGTKVGILGGVAAAGVGATVLGKQVFKKVRRVAAAPRAPPPPPTVLAAAPLVAGALPSATTLQQPLGPVQKPTKVEKAVPSIKITNKPEINISFRKTRKFINQQVLVKP